MKITAKKRAKKFGKNEYKHLYLLTSKMMFYFFSFSHNKTESSGG